MIVGMPLAIVGIVVSRLKSVKKLERTISKNEVTYLLQNNPQ